MKKWIILPVIAAVLVGTAVLAYFLIKNTGRYDYSLLESVKITRRGTMLPVETVYELKKESGAWTAVYSNQDITGEEDDQNATVRFNADEAFVHAVIDLLKSNKAGRWNGFSKSNKNVFDGSRFQFEAAFSDGKTIEAEGYMSYPRNFHTVENGIIALFEPYIK